MKKRLRKKKKVGEYKVAGVPLRVHLEPGTAADPFMDDFVAEAIEPNASLSSAFPADDPNEESLDFFVELGRWADNPESRLDKITTWLNDAAAVKKFEAGKITDARLPLRNMGCVVCSTGGRASSRAGTDKMA